MNNLDPMLALEDAEVDPAMKAQAASRSTWVSVAVNTTLSALQVAVGMISGSSGLIADGIHSLSDLVADFLVPVSYTHLTPPTKA